MGLDTSSFIDEYSSFVLLPSAVSLAETRGSPVRGFRKIPIGNEAISLFGLPGPLTTSKTRIDPRGRLTRTDPTFVETILTRWVERSWVRSDPGSQRSDRSWNRALVSWCHGHGHGHGHGPGPDSTNDPIFVTRNHFWPRIARPTGSKSFPRTSDRSGSSDPSDRSWFCLL